MNVPSCLLGAAAALAAGLAGAAAAHAQANPSFVLANRSGAAATAAYAAPAGSQGWGPSRLGAALPPGASIPLRLPLGQCTWDIRVSFEGAPDEERRGVNLCETTDLAFGLGPEPAGPPNPSFSFVSKAGKPVAELLVSPSNHPNWGQNRLPRSTVLQDGASFPVRLPSGDCVYDVRAVYADGSALERRKLDACDAVGVALP